jgi:hypothetical protein
MNTLVDLSGEEWLPFRNYMISNKGRVWSNRQQKLVCKKEDVSYKHPDGTPRYRMVSWSNEGRNTWRKISLVVMRIFGPPNPNPEYFNCVDHISGDYHDDSIENLRWLPTFQNNIWSQKTKGYCLHKASGKYRARIGTPVKRISLGLHNTPEEAEAVYFAARDRAMELCLGDLVIRTPESVVSYVKTGAW